MNAIIAIFEVLFLVGIVIGVYVLGYSDGRWTEREKHLWEEMDKLIERVSEPRS